MKTKILCLLILSTIIYPQLITDLKDLQTGNIDEEIIPTIETHFNRDFSFSIDRDLIIQDTLNYGLTSNVNFGFYPGDKMMEVYKAPRDLTLNGVGIDINNWNGDTTFPNLKVEVYRPTYPFNELGSTYPDTIVDANGWLGYAHHVNNDSIPFADTSDTAGLIWNDFSNSLGYCDNTQEMENVQSVIGTNALPSGTSEYTITRPDTNEYGYSPGGIYWVDFTDVGGVEFLEDEYIAIIVTYDTSGSASGGRIGFNAGNASDIFPYPGVKFYQSVCNGTSGEAGWHIRHYTWRFNYAVESEPDFQVPDDFLTIQTAIDSADDSDLILVAPGTYNETLMIDGKDIRLVSHHILYPDSFNLIDSTIITALDNNSPTITFSVFDEYDNGVLDTVNISSALIQGFTFSGGYLYDSGLEDDLSGDNYFNNVTIKRCNFINSGYNIFTSNPTFQFCLFNNSPITNSNNQHWSNIYIYNSTLYGLDDHIFDNPYNQSQVQIYNSVLSGSINNLRYSISFYYSCLDTTEYSTDGEFEYYEGNVFGDPLFCDPANNDFTLHENSPCIGNNEYGVNMGLFGIGCEAAFFPPEVESIDDITIQEDSSASINVVAESPIGIPLSFSAFSDTIDVDVSINSDSVNTLILTPSDNWFGSSVISVIVSDEWFSDSITFVLTVEPVNDSPEPSSVIYPTVTDTFSTHVDSDTAITFNWEESYDVDSDVTYTLTIELEFFGNTYTDVHENISDTTFSLSSNTLDALLGALNIDETELNWYIYSSDGEYMVASDVGEFVLFRGALGVNEGLSVPDVYALHQNYPNPFNPITTLRYDLPEQANVNIIIYDLLGREVRTLVNTTQDAGFKSVIWNATNDYGKPVSAGVYLYQIRAGEFVQTRKMVLLK
jgi:hypothetical protein